MTTVLLYNIPDPPVDEADHAPGAVDTQCTSSVLRSHSYYESTIAGPSKLCVNAGFEQLNEAASSDENDEMDPDEGNQHVAFVMPILDLHTNRSYYVFMKKS